MNSSNFIHKSYFIPILTLCLLFLCSQIVQSQTITPAIMAQINSELKKRDLTESEARVRLLQKGIDLENISPAQLPNYQKQVIAVLDELQAEKKQGAKKTTTLTPAADSIVQPATTKQEAIAEATIQMIQSAIKKDSASSIYGHSLFNNQSLKVFRTTDGAQAPDTYVLGEGDDIRITIFGASQTDIQQKISTDGSIQPTGVSKIFLKGLTLAQAREVIQERLSSAYTFQPDQFAVTIVTARTVLINVFGEAKITGGFSISALNSVLNALSAAGGPSEIGSVREIQLIRGNTRKTIDIYAFMNDPSTQFKFDIQNNDIIFVPVVKLLVSIQGAVKRPMTYEMLPTETLIDLIRYAGDVKMDVVPDFVQVQRYINGEQRLLEYNLADIRSGQTKVELLNGDIIRIKSIDKPLDQYVEVDGSVYYPGRYDLSANQMLSNLLRNAKPTYQAKTDFLFVERIRPDSTIEVLTVPFEGINSGAKDFALNPRDRVKIMNQSAYRDIDTISVAGHVRSPFKKTFAINDKITVKDAIEMAGGLKTSVYPVAYILRKNLLNPIEKKYIRLELSQAERTDLQPGDQLNIYDNSTYTNAGDVKLFGAVKNPLTLTYDSTLTLRDLLIQAGGFTIGAAFNRVEVFRTILSSTEQSKLELITLSVDSTYQLVSPTNFKLQPYDQVVVRLIPEFTMGRTIEITGQVKYPGTYVLESKEVQLSDIIKTAGDLLEDADLDGSSLFRTYRKRGNISVNIQKTISHSGNLSSDPILFDGDVININRRENTVIIREIGTRMAQYSINPVSTQKNVIYQGSKSAAWYIRNYAGGFQQRANHNSVTVTLPNDQMLSTKRFLLFFRNYPNPTPGSTISLQMKPEKVIPIEGKKTDWESISTKTTASLTAVMTMYLLFQQLTK